MLFLCRVVEKYKDIDEGVRGKCEDGKSIDGNNIEVNGLGRPVTKRVFKAPQSEAKIFELSNKNFAIESRRKIRWAVNMYDQWRIVRLKNVMVEPQIRRTDLSYVNDFSKDDLCFALSRFIREIRKIDNSDYPPNTLREIIVMVQMHLHQNGLFRKLLDGDSFVMLRNVLDNTMKERTAQGLGVRKSCDIISLVHEDRMFECGALGESNPEQLLRTIIYMLGLHLALRGGIEHMRLRRPGFQCQIVNELDEETGKEILIYTEDALQKTNQGGLVGKPTHKVVRIFPSENVNRCPVRLFCKYLSLLPQGRSCGKLYLRPKQKFTPCVWYCDQPYGKNKVGTTVKKLCEMAKIEGRFSNHSLRATSASRMFHQNIPEQVIKEITGHKSDCVRVYKRTNKDLLQKASNCIGGVLTAESVGSDVTMKEVVKIDEKQECVKLSESQKERLNESLSACQIIKNVVKTRMELRKKQQKPVLRKVASRILKKQKRKKCKRKIGASKIGQNRTMTIDINLNVNVKK